MAFFKKKEEKEEKRGAAQEEAVAEAAPTAPATAAPSAAAAGDVRDVLLRPRITEKATKQLSENVYTFEVRPDANKRQVADAVRRIYNVTPVKVNITKLPSKTVRSRVRRGEVGSKGGVKKALVFLKEGDTIQFV